MSYYYKCYKLGVTPYAEETSPSTGTYYEYGLTGEKTVLWDNSIPELGIVSGSLCLKTSVICSGSAQMYATHPNISAVEVGALVQICRVRGTTETPMFSGYISTVDEDIIGNKTMRYTDFISLLDFVPYLASCTGAWYSMSSILSKIFTNHNKYSLLEFTTSYDTPNISSVWINWDANTTAKAALDTLVGNSKKPYWTKDGSGDVITRYLCPLRYFIDSASDPLKLKVVDDNQDYCNTQEINFGENIIDLTINTSMPDATTVYGTNTNGYTFTGVKGWQNSLTSYLGVKSNIVSWTEKSYDGSDSTAFLNNMRYDVYHAPDPTDGYYTDYTVQRTYSITVYDLSYSNDSIDPFDYTKLITVKSARHNIDDITTISQYDVDLVSPANSKVTVGGTIARITK